MGAVPAPLEADTGATLACELSGVTKVFGAVRAVDDVTLDIVEGSLTCLIGPNGAGKSTLLGCISGFLVADEGSVRVGGRDVTRQPPHLRAQQGLATVFQTTRPLERAQRPRQRSRRRARSLPFGLRREHAAAALAAA